MELSPIITEKSSEIRARARVLLRNRWKEVVLCLLAVVLIMLIPQYILTKLTGTVSNIPFNGENIQVEQAPLANLYTFVITGPIAVSFMTMMLKFYDGIKLRPAMLLDRINYFLKSLGLYFMIMVFTTLWTLLFIIPGIIAAFRYSQAFFIMAEDLEKGIMDCIRESKLMMKGNKSKLFWLQLSFIGWAILASIPIGIASGVTEAIVINDVAGDIITYIFSIGMLWLYAYVCVTNLVFFKMLRGQERLSADYVQFEDENRYEDRYDYREF